MTRRLLLLLSTVGSTVLVAIGLIVGGSAGTMLAVAAAAGWALTTVIVCLARDHGGSLSPGPDVELPPDAPRWVGGGNLPARIGRVSASWPLVAARVHPGLAEVTVRPRVLAAATGVPARVTFTAAPEVVVFRARGALGNRAVGIQRGADSPWYLLVRERDALLNALHAAGFSVVADERKMQYR